MYNKVITSITKLREVLNDDPQREEQVDSGNAPDSTPRDERWLRQCELLGELEVAQFIRKIFARDMERFSSLAASSDFREVQSKGTASLDASPDRSNLQPKSVLCIPT